MPCVQHSGGNMQFSKIICLQCSQIGECPKRTRMFVNYCGSRQERIAKDVRGAIHECQNRRGYIIKRFPEMQELRKSA